MKSYPIRPETETWYSVVAVVIVVDGAGWRLIEIIPDWKFEILQHRVADDVNTCLYIRKSHSQPPGRMAEKEKMS